MQSEVVWRQSIASAVRDSLRTWTGNSWSILSGLAAACTESRFQSAMVASFLCMRDQRFSFRQVQSGALQRPSRKHNGERHRSTTEYIRSVWLRVSNLYALREIELMNSKNWHRESSSSENTLINLWIECAYKACTLGCELLGNGTYNHFKWKKKNGHELAVSL